MGGRGGEGDCSKIGVTRGGIDLLVDRRELCVSVEVRSK
jgi:hypothetical protein